MNKVVKWIGNMLFGILVVIAALSLIVNINAKRNSDNIPSFLGYKPMTVLTGSMAPRISPGDIIIDSSVTADNIKVGDVVTYKATESMLITHRIIEIINENGKNMYKTKGDANNTDDGKLVSPEQIVGRVSFRIPYGGYVSRFASSIYGLILLILVPTGLLIWQQIKTILSEREKEKAKKII